MRPRHPQYPEKPITFVVPSTRGVRPTSSPRALGQEVTAQTKQAVVVDNKAGASGVHRRATGRQGGAGRLHRLHYDEHDARGQRALVQVDHYDPVKDFAR